MEKLSSAAGWRLREVPTFAGDQEKSERGLVAKGAPCFASGQPKKSRCQEEMTRGVCYCCCCGISAAARSCWRSAPPPCPASASPIKSGGIEVALMSLETGSLLYSSNFLRWILRH